MWYLRSSCLDSLGTTDAKKGVQSPPRIDFGSVVLGKTKVRTLLICKPHDYEQDVIVERFPYKKKFLIEEEGSRIFSPEKGASNSRLCSQVRP